jgi:hypothetical protein
MDKGTEAFDRLWDAAVELDRLVPPTDTPDEWDGLRTILRGHGPGTRSGRRWHRLHEIQPGTREKVREHLDGEGSKHRAFRLRRAIYGDPPGRKDYEWDYWAQEWFYWTDIADAVALGLPEEGTEDHRAFRVLSLTAQGFGPGGDHYGRVGTSTLRELLGEEATADWPEPPQRRPRPVEPQLPPGLLGMIEDQRPEVERLTDENEDLRAQLAVPRSSREVGLLQEIERLRAIVFDADSEINSLLGCVLTLPSMLAEEVDDPTDPEDPPTPRELIGYLREITSSNVEQVRRFVMHGEPFSWEEPDGLRPNPCKIWGFEGLVPDRWEARRGREEWGVWDNVRQVWGPQWAWDTRQSKAEKYAAQLNESEAQGWEGAQS